MQKSSEYRDQKYLKLQEHDTFFCKISKKNLRKKRLPWYTFVLQRHSNEEMDLEKKVTDMSINMIC